MSQPTKLALDNYEKCIVEMVDVFSSYKRLQILLLMVEGPKGYKAFEQDLTVIKIKAGSSELYKSLYKLEKHGFVQNKNHKWILTDKGKRLVDGINHTIVRIYGE